jgi:hypothetical protein
MARLSDHQRHSAAGAGVMDHHRRAGPRARTASAEAASDRDRPACRARSGGSSFPRACRARRTRTRSGAHGRGALTKAGSTRERGLVAGGAPAEIR